MQFCTFVPISSRKNREQKTWAHAKNHDHSDWVWIVIFQLLIGMALWSLFGVHWMSYVWMEDCSDHVEDTFIRRSFALLFIANVACLAVNLSLVCYLPMDGWMHGWMAEQFSSAIWLLMLLGCFQQRNKVKPRPHSLLWYYGTTEMPKTTPQWARWRCRRWRWKHGRRRRMSWWWAVIQNREWNDGIWHKFFARKTENPGKEQSHWTQEIRKQIQSHILNNSDLGRNGNVRSN